MRLLFILIFFIIIKNSYSINWTKEFNGISSSEKINLSNGGTISHYKNSGNWKDSLGNYGKGVFYGTVESSSEGGDNLKYFNPNVKLIASKIKARI